MELAHIGFIGRVIGALGAILVARTALRVHHRVWQEHQIDEKVSNEMHREQRYGLIGISGMMIGLVMDVSTFLLLEVI